MRMLLLALVACAPPPTGGAAFDPEAFIPGDRTLGPFAHHDRGATCSRAGWGPELGGIELLTGPCPYVSLQAPLDVQIRAGDTLRVSWWHQQLASLTPAEGHIALTTEDAILWERTVEIPHAAESHVDDAIAPVDLDPGTPIFMHLHNHGANAWTLFHVEHIPQ